MTKISINSEPVEWTKLSYHFQKVPKPGGGTYIIEVERKDSLITTYIENMVGKRIDDADFGSTAKGHFATTYNLVQYVLWKMEESFGQGLKKPLWVLNNIRDVFVSKDTLTITGECSPFVENFGDN